MKEWSTRKALFYLIGSTTLTATLSLFGGWLWKNHQKTRLHSEKYRIQTIVQTGPEKEALKTAYLAELLDLSVDAPTQLYALDLKAAEKKLLASPLIKAAKLKRIPPCTLYIDYEVRKPVAWLSDYKNIAIDKDGYLFPVTSFLSPKQLPEIYLGQKEFSWNLSGEPLTLALEILLKLESAPWTAGLKVQRIDVSNAFSPSLGTREIVLFTEEEIVFSAPKEAVYTFPKILRLAPRGLEQQLSNFFSLRKTMLSDYSKQLSSLNENECVSRKFSPRIIDLRIPQLAFVEK